ncbi:hypothetical protein LQW54_003584 [Pestalotiopsis sp. IQ-011]
MAIDASKTVVVITGANRGIGLEIVKALLTAAPTSSSGGAPYHVYLGTRDLDKGKKAAANLTADHGNTVSALQIDTTSDSSISSAVATVKSETGNIDILVNNVGIIYEDKDRVSNLRTTLETNVVATYAVSEAFLPLLRAQPSQGRKAKRIINVTSDLGSITWRSDPSNYAYSIVNSEYRMSKAALNMMTACQAYELKEHDVKVFAFNPGYTITELFGPVELRRKTGAWEADVPGKACVKIIAGERDDEAGQMVQVEGTVPW